jgi:hypothetical protein
MARWEDLYQDACNFAANWQREELDADMRKIWLLMGALSEAFWRHAQEPGVSVMEKIWRNNQRYHPDSEDEIALWNELTAPHNYAALLRYAALSGGQIYATGALEVARSRWEAGPNEWQQQTGPT